MISAVITTYNGSSLLKKNLTKTLSLLDKSRLEYELIIVDDASTDDSRVFLERLKSRNSKIKTIYKTKNEGFASTVDMGIRMAKGEYVFTLKTDTVPEKVDYFELLLQHFKNNPKLFAVSSTLKSIENGKEELRGCGQIYFEKGFFLHRRISNLSKISAWADGSASVFNKEIYEKIGGFDSLFNPFYWEDVDLGYRAWKAGYTIEYERNAVLLHDHEKGAISAHYSASQIEFIALRNQFLFFWKNADLENIGQFFFYLPYNVAIALKNLNWDFFAADFWSDCHFLPIFHRRVTLKKMTVKSDSEVLKVFNL